MRFLMLFEDQLPFPTCDANCSIELGCIMQCSALMQCLTNSINQIVWRYVRLCNEWRMKPFTCSDLVFSWYGYKEKLSAKFLRHHKFTPIVYKRKNFDVIVSNRISNIAWGRLSNGSDIGGSDFWNARKKKLEKYPKIIILNYMERNVADTTKTHHQKNQDLLINYMGIYSSSSLFR